MHKPEVVEERHLALLDALVGSWRFQTYGAIVCLSREFPELTHEEKQDVYAYWKELRGRI